MSWDDRNVVLSELRLDDQYNWVCSDQLPMSQHEDHALYKSLNSTKKKVNDS
jgi:hypothetical protein